MARGPVITLSEQERVALFRPCKKEQALLDALDPQECRMLGYWMGDVDEVMHGYSKWTPDEIVPLLESSEVLDWRRSGRTESLRLTDKGKAIVQLRLDRGARLYAAAIIRLGK